jgi:hypothetical protein
LGLITEEQLELLEGLVDAYWGDGKGAKEEFVFSSTWQGGTSIHQFQVNGRESVAYGDIEELAAQGFISMTHSDSASRSGTLRPTAAGQTEVEKQRRVAEITRADLAISAGGPGVGWEATLPVLETVMDLYDQASAGEDVSQMQVAKQLGREEGDSGVSRAFEVLERNGYVVAGGMNIDSIPGPLTVAPTEKAMQLLAGWPTSGEAAVEKLISILDERIDSTPDEEKKGKLRALRDSLIDVGEGIAAEVMVKVLTG